MIWPGPSPAATWPATLDTGLPAGEYCNLLDDCATRVTVDAAGRGAFAVPRDAAVALRADRPAP